MISTPEILLETSEILLETPETLLETPETLLETPETLVETPETLVETPETPKTFTDEISPNKYINDKELYDKNECNKNMYSKKCNDIINSVEIKEREELLTINDKDFLYPNLNDKNFNIKISEKKNLLIHHMMEL